MPVLSAFKTTMLAKANLMMLIFGICLPLLLASIDSYMVSAAISAISGELGVRREIGLWVISLHTVARAIAFPIAGRMAPLVGLRPLFLTAVAVYTLSSFCAGFINSWNALLISRMIQGFSGGVIAISSLSIMTEQFPPQHRSTPVVIWNLFTFVGPSLGPFLGGLFSTVHWHWLFFISVPLCIASFFMVLASSERIPPLEQQKSFDGIGAMTMALLLGLLQVMVDRGQVDDWFRSYKIITLCTIVVILFVFFVIWEWFHDSPIVDLRLILSDPFIYIAIIVGEGTALVFAGFLLESLWLYDYMGYPPVSLGLVVAPLGIIPPILYPLCRLFIPKFCPRFWTAIGLAILCCSYFLYARINLFYTTFQFLAGVRCLQGLAIPLLTASSALLIYRNVPEAKLPYVAAMYSFVRYVITSLTQSLMQTLWIHRTAFYQTRMAERSDPSMPRMQSLLSDFVPYVSSPHQDIAVANSFVEAQAATLGLADVYYLFAWIYVGLIFLVCLYYTRKTVPVALRP